MAALLAALAALSWLVPLSPLVHEHEDGHETHTHAAHPRHGHAHVVLGVPVPEPDGGDPLGQGSPLHAHGCDPSDGCVRGSAGVGLPDVRAAQRATPPLARALGEDRLGGDGTPPVPRPERDPDVAPARTTERLVRLGGLLS